ncbi:hypothetical protein ACH4VT_33650 [Streptomyces lydicus]|uniref:hypothetical protein n=1 Tax=Streptomyces lydicus TaxID=47763 RepID=UPI00379A0A2E
MRTGRTYTTHFDLDPRQHELLGWDLGEGAPRRAVVLALVLLVLWSIPLLLIFGLPNEITFSFYFPPPVVAAIYGAQRSSRTDRRRNMTNWALLARYLTVGHRPVICGGRRAATRNEWIPLRERWGERADTAADLPGLAGLPWLFGRHRTRATTAGPDLHLSACPRVYGPDRVWRARKRAGNTKNTKGRQR